EGDERPLGKYRLHEFFTFRGEIDVLNWSCASSACLQLARNQAASGDKRFQEAWESHQQALERVLQRYVRPPFTIDDVLQSTWLAVHLTYLPGSLLEFNPLLKVALDVYRR